MTHPPTVAIVDDDAGLVAALQHRCEALGFRVMSFCNLPRAVLCIAGGRPDVVLLDINMASGDGLAACEDFALMAREQSFPIIMMTANADSRTKRRIRLAGARYVRKGMHLWDRLEPVLLECLGRSRPEPHDTAGRRTAAAEFSSEGHDR